MSRPTFRQIEYFIMLSESGSFRAAALRLHVSQPTLSGQIAELESRLGAVLFERGRTGARLTRVGEALLPRARRLMLDIADFTSAARSTGGFLADLLRLGVPPTLGPYLLPMIVPELHLRWPKLRLYVREDVPDALETGLREGRFDLILTSLDGDIDSFETMELFREPLLVGLARDHPLAGRDLLHSRDLRDLPILALGKAHRLHDRVVALCRRFGATLLADYEGTSLDTLRQMVGMGMGLSVFPYFYTRSEMTADRAVIVKPLADRAMSRPVGLIWRRQSPGGEAYRMLGQLIAGIALTGPDN